MVHNGSFSGIALFGTSRGNTIEKNLVTDNNICRPVGTRTLCEDDGIRLEPGTNHNTVTKNEVLRNGLDGITVFRNATDTW